MDRVRYRRGAHQLPAVLAERIQCVLYDPCIISRSPRDDLVFPVFSLVHKHRRRLHMRTLRLLRRWRDMRERGLWKFAYVLSHASIVSDSISETQVGADGLVRPVIHLTPQL